MRAVILDNNELKKYIDNMTAQKENLEKSLLDLSIYSNGSITLQDLYNLPSTKLEPIQKTLTSKIEMDLGINSKKYL